jgi:hypothetical protein
MTITYMIAHDRATALKQQTDEYRHNPGCEDKKEDNSGQIGFQGRTRQFRDARVATAPQRRQL